jgi:hypothetical protein
MLAVGKQKTFKTLRRFLAFGFLFVTDGKISAMAPAFVSDEDLAQYSVVVVAKWEKAPFRANHRYDERDQQKVVTAIESFTDLNVLRVIKGDVKPGRHALMIGWGIAWSQNGNWVTSGTSTELRGDVQDVTEPNIWFLQESRSWEQTNRIKYLSVSHYRAIQPVFLEEYFTALASAQPKMEVPKLLTSTNAGVVRRSLLYVCGGLRPWPYDSDFDTKYLGRKQGTVLRDQARAVAAVIERKDSNEVRALSVAVHAELEGAKCVQYVRTLLGDHDLDVRAAAVAVLVRYKDSESLDEIGRTVTGKESGSVACKIIEAMSGWGEVRLVPALAAFLECGELAYRYGDDVGIPALKAREVLHRMTGHWFPYDREASLRAWKEASQISDFGKRQQLLATILPNDPNPLKADVVGDGGINAACRITNKSRHDVVVTRCPTWGEQSWPAGTAGSQSGMEQPKGKKDFVVLRPGESTQCDIKFHAGFLLADPGSRKLILEYWDTGQEWAMHAWIGSVQAQFGTDWKGQRKLEDIQEQWPNGNFKAKGKTMNGERYGAWHYFNEDGDRIRIVDYTGGHGPAECNPEHPDNKGAGKRRIPK